MTFCETCGGEVGEKSKYCGLCGAPRLFSAGVASRGDREPAPVVTTFAAKCSILSQIWVEMRDLEQFADFMSFGDLGIPLAHAIHNGIVEPTPEATKFIDEVFEVLLGILGVDEDQGFANLDALLSAGTEDFDTSSYADEYDDDGEDDPGFQFFQINIFLEGPIRFEDRFRTKTLQRIFRESKAKDFDDWYFGERTQENLYSPGYAIAYDPEQYTAENMKLECPACGRLNPRTAQVCYLCCNMLVDEIKGKLFAAVCQDASWHELREFSAPSFARWVNVYYFVAEKGNHVALFEPNFQISGY
jgi:hypothetical protein